jgi:predicted O-linked N-acetylglucosamine transferase (SPINDLY family)
MNRSERRRQEKMAKKQQGAGTGQGPIQDMLAKGIAHHQKGELPQAEQHYKAILNINPQHGDANHLMGLLAKQVGKPEIAKQFLEKALLANPNHPHFLNNMGGVLKELGDLEGAQTHHLLAVKADPKFAQGYNSLGLVEKALENFEAAQHAFETAIEIQPQNPEFLNNLGNLHTDFGAPEKGLEYIDRSLQLAPDLINTQYNRAVSLQKSGRTGEAIAQYGVVLKAAPNFAAAHCNLGILAREQNELATAIAHGQKAAELEPQNADYYYNLGLALYEAGEYEDALACFEGAFTIKPDHAHAQNDHGNVYFAMRQFENAITSYKKAVDLAPNSAGMHNNLGNAYLKIGSLAEAKEEFSRALELRPSHANAHSNLASLYKDLGELELAHHHYKQALEHEPNFTVAYSNMLFTMNYDPHKSGEEIYEWYKEFNRRYAAPLRSEQKPHENDRSIDRRLRVGYVSAAFHKHSAVFHLLPLFEGHSKKDFEIFAYADIAQTDDYTEQYKANCDHWIKINDLDNAALVDRIRSDQIDILVDISGHTRGGRLLTFARRPAPVSLHWLDFGYTTGMDAIDYYLGDENVTPERDDHLFGEREVWRLDGPSVVYRPGPDMGEVSPLPAKQNGFVTFCTLSRSVRLNEKTIKVWADILKRVDGSKLRLDSRNYQDPMMCDQVAEKFAKFGIERDRLIMGFNSPPWDVLREIDIALDCFPHNSGTTLFEHLYMGNPYVTLYNRASVGTLGGAILRHAGFGEWVAQSEDEYVDLAVNLASDLDKLADIRATMRAKMEDSPAMDEEAFVTRMENSYRQMWKRYCEAE